MSNEITDRSMARSREMKSKQIFELDNKLVIN